MKKTLLLFFMGLFFNALFSQVVFINEIHYDNASTDVNEGVEIAGTAGTDMTGWSIYFYNGSNGATYANESITGTIPDQQGGFGTIWIAHASIQNGPDAIALVDDSSKVIQFLSYEGSFEAVDGPASGMTSTDIGVSETGSTNADSSIQLRGTGEMYEDFTWAADLTATPGGVNMYQSFGYAPEPDNHVSGFAAGTPTFSRIPLNWTDATGTILPGGYLIKSSTVGFADISAPVDGVEEDESMDVKKIATGVESALFSILEASSTYYFKIYPFSNSGANIDYKTDGTVPEVSATTGSDANIAFFQSFEGDPDGWIIVSDSGAQEWEPADIGADGTHSSGYINGFNFSDEINVDWAITPAANLDAWSSEVLTFYTRYRFGTIDEKDYLKLYYSDDYNGMADASGINSATWTEIPFDTASSQQTWHKTADIDLSNINGPNVYFGFKYRSDNNQRAWWIDEITITGTFTGETDPPVWNNGYPAVDDVRETQFDVVVNMNEPGHAFFLVLSDGAAAPSNAEVRAGDTLMIELANQDFSTTVDNLSEATSYDVYFIAEDQIGNEQASPVKVDVTTAQRSITLTYPVGGEVFYVGDTITATWTASGMDSLTLWAYIWDDDFWAPVSDSALLASAGSYDIPVPLDAGIDSVLLRLSDYQDTSFHDKSDWFYLSDTLKPMIVNTWPADGVTGVGTSASLTIEFNEEVYQGSGYIRIMESGAAYIDSIMVDTNSVYFFGDVIVIQPSKTFMKNTSYHVLIDEGAFVDFQDNAFSGIQDEAAWNFTTIGDDLFFSEYIEGGSNRKALEIYNPADQPANLNDYRIAQSSNGGGWQFMHYFPTDSVLDPGDLWVIITDHSSFDTMTVFDKSTANEVLGFPSVVHHNGNDARAIQKTNDGGETWYIVDVFGDPDSDQNFDVAGVEGAASNHTIWRKPFVTGGNSDWYNSAGTNTFDSEWIVGPIDDFSNLGKLTPMLDSLADIESFTLVEEFKPAVIDSAAATIAIEVTLGTDLSKLYPEFTLSEGAGSVPASGDSIDFSGGPVTIVVTAADRQNVRNWVVTVTEHQEPSTENKILGFELDEQTGDAVIDTVNFTVTAEVMFGTSLNGLSPTIRVSGAATISPESGTAQDWSAGDVTYTVTAQDGSTQEWVTTVTVQAPMEVANVTALRAGMQDGTAYKLTGEAVLTGQMSFRSKKYIQDAGAGIEIDDPDGVITTSYSVGDGITGIVGTLSEFNGMIQFTPVVDPGAPSSTGNALSPLEVSIADFKTKLDDYEGRLVKLNEFVSFADIGSFENGTNYDISGAAETTVLRIHFWDTDLTGTEIPGKANVTGIAIEFNGTSQIAPRGLDDVVPYTVSVEALRSQTEIRLYPNPNSGRFTLEWSGERTDIEIEIFSINGKMMYRNSFDDVSRINEQIDLTDAERGLYLLRIRNAEEVNIHKIVIR